MSNTAALVSIRADIDAIRARLFGAYARIPRSPSTDTSAHHVAIAYAKLVTADAHLKAAIAYDPDPTIVVDVTPRAGAAA